MKHVKGTHLSKMYRASEKDTPAMSKTIAVIEEFGRSLSDTLLTDDTVDSVVALGLGVMNVIQRLPPGSVPTHVDFNEYLRVPDAESLEVFLKQARKVYRKAHSRTHTQGRPMVDLDAFETLLKLSSGPGTAPSQTKMASKLMEEGLSKNTADKYAKLYRLALRWASGRPQFTDAERRWLAKNEGVNPMGYLYLRLYLCRNRWVERNGR